MHCPSMKAQKEAIKRLSRASKQPSRKDEGFHSITKNTNILIQGRVGLPFVPSLAIQTVFLRLIFNRKYNFDKDAE